MEEKTVLTVAFETNAKIAVVTVRPMSENKHKAIMSGEIE